MGIKERGLRAKALDPNTTEEELRQISKTPIAKNDWWVRDAIAQAEHVSPKLLMEYKSNDSSAVVRDHAEKHWLLLNG